MTGLNAQRHRQLARDILVCFVSVRQGYMFAEAISCFPHTNLPHRPVQSGSEAAIGTLILFSLSTLVSKLQAEKHLSSESSSKLCTKRNQRHRRQYTYNKIAGLSAFGQGVYPNAQRVTAFCFTSQRFLKVISLLCVPPAPPLSVNQVTLVVFIQLRNVSYY